MQQVFLTATTGQGRKTRINSPKACFHWNTSLEWGKVLRQAVAKNFAICASVFQFWTMTTPLALAFYQHLLPGSQVVNGLQDLGYRVQTISDVQTLVLQSLQEKPLVVVADLAAANG